MNDTINIYGENKKPILSVIIPVYNVEPFLEEALQSVLNQSFHDMEVICVNDGSTDDSAKILKTYAAKDSRIRLVDQENQGLSAARNRGVELACGEFLYYFDSDDLLEETAFEELVPRMQQDDLELLFFNVTPFADEGVTEKTLKNYEKYYHREGSYPGVMKGLELMVRQLDADEFLVGAWGYVARRSFVNQRQLRFAEGLLHEDNLYTFCAMLWAERAGYLDHALFKRRLRSGSITQSKQTFAHAYGYFYTYQKALEIFRDEKKIREEALPGWQWEELTGIIKQIADWLRSARNVYAALDAGERSRVNELTAEELALFKVHIADVCVQKEAAERARKKAEAKATDAKKEVLKYKEEAEKKQKRITEIEGSRAYRFGTAVAQPVRKMKKDRAVNKKESGENSAESFKNEVQKDGCTGKDISTEKNNKKTIWFFGSPSHGNLGDHMIAEGSLAFFYEYYPDVVIREIPRDDAIRNLNEITEQIRPEDMIFFIGGGNLGNYWPDNEKIRQEIIRRFPNNKKIVLPQSIQFTNDDAGKAALKEACEVYSDQNLLLVCRGRASLEFARSHFRCVSVMAPDMVMGCKVPAWWLSAANRRGAVLCLRQDKERFLTDDDMSLIEKTLQGSFAPNEIRKTDMVRPKAVSPQNRRSELAKQYRLFSGAEVVITDRLHCMIFCAQTGTPCVVFPNDHHKITECYAWMADLPYIKLIEDVSDLSDAIQEVRHVPYPEYPYRRIRSGFTEMLDAINVNVYNHRSSV